MKTIHTVTIFNRRRSFLNSIGSVIGVAMVLITAFVALTLTNLVHAEENKQPSTSITVSPAASRLNLSPGQIYEGKYTIINTGAKAFDFDVSVKPYSVNDEQYNANIDKETSYTQIARWVSFNQTEYHLESGESVEIIYHVNVPEDVPNGGQYAVILNRTAGESTGEGSINTMQQVGMLIYAKLGGETREEGKVKSQTINQFYFSPPVNIGSLVQNTGNIDFDANYKVSIKTLFGHEAYTHTQEHSILPDTSRQVDIVWENAPALGIFYVTQDIIILGEAYSETKLIVIMPLWVIITTIILFGILGIVIITKIRHRINHNKINSKPRKSTRNSNL